MGIEYKMIGGDGREYGPATLEELRAWAEDGRVGPSTFIWRNDEGRWLPAGSRDELKWDLPPAAEATPSTSAAPPILPAKGYYAGFGPRMAAFLTDFIIVQVISSMLSVPWAKDAQAMAAKWQLGATADPEALLAMYVQGLPVLLPMLAVYYLVSISYHVGCNGRFGFTPGKWLLGLEIVTVDGAPIGAGRAFKRYAAELLSGLSLGFGYLLVAIHHERCALHDLVAGTRVIHRS